MTGVAELNGSIYIVVEESDRIKVFGSPPSYNSLEDIVVDGMEYPQDVAADLTAGTLYIADYYGQCVWKVNVRGRRDSDDDEKVDRDKLSLIDGYPWSLSVTETGQVLVVDYFKDELTITSDQDDEKSSNIVKLKDYYLSGTSHLIRTSPEVYLVAHGRPEVEGYISIRR